MFPSISVPEDSFVFTFGDAKKSPIIKAHHRDVGIRKALRKIYTEAITQLRGKPDNPIYSYWATLRYLTRKLLERHSLKIWAVKQLLSRNAKFDQAGYEAACFQLFKM